MFCFTHSKYRGKNAHLTNYWYNMITIVVILNCNQTSIKEMHREMLKYGNTGDT